MVDLKRALRFSADLGLVASVDDFTTDVLAGLADLVPANLWGFNDLDPGSRQMIAAIWPPDGARPEDFEAVAKVVWQHPVVEIFQRTGTGPPTRLSDVWSRARYRSSALYRDAYRAMGVEYQVCFSIADGPVAATIGLAANRSDRDFADDELEVLDLLRPALRSAWQRVQTSSALAAMIDGLGATTSRSLLLVDAKSRLRAGGEDAVAWLRAAGVPVEPGAPVPEPVLGWLRRGGGRRDLFLGSGADELRLEVVAGAREADRVVAVSTVQSDQRFGLTPRELEVVSVAAQGCTNTEIAAGLGVSVHTVEKHLGRAFAKLGVSNRTAAAARLAERRGQRAVGET